MAEGKVFQKGIETMCAVSPGSGRLDDRRKYNASLFNAAAKPKDKKKWIARNDLWLSKGGVRPLLRASVDGAEYWMDCVTGTLYDDDGRCLSSITMRIDTSEMIDGGEAAAKHLMQIKSKFTD